MCLLCLGGAQSPSLAAISLFRSSSKFSVDPSSALLFAAEQHHYKACSYYRLNSIQGGIVCEFTIGELFQLTQVNIETIRYYEKISVIPNSPLHSALFSRDQIAVLAIPRLRRS